MYLYLLGAGIISFSIGVMNSAVHGWFALGVFIIALGIARMGKL